MLFVFLLYLPLSAAIFHCQLYFHPQSCCMWIWDAFMLVFNAFKIRPHPPPEELQQTWSQFVLKRLWSVSTSHLSFCVVSTGNYSKEECCGMICIVSDVFNCLFFCGFTWKQRKKKPQQLIASCVVIPFGCVLERAGSLWYWWTSTAGQIFLPDSYMRSTNANLKISNLKHTSSHLGQWFPSSGPWAGRAPWAEPHQAKKKVINSKNRQVTCLLWSN